MGRDQWVPHVRILGHGNVHSLLSSRAGCRVPHVRIFGHGNAHTLLSAKRSRGICFFHRLAQRDPVEAPRLQPGDKEPVRKDHTLLPQAGVQAKPKLYALRSHYISSFNPPYHFFLYKDFPNPCAILLMQP
jgi:hypothetical protein